MEQIKFEFYVAHLQFKFFENSPFIAVGHNIKSAVL